MPQRAKSSPPHTFGPRMELIDTHTHLFTKHFNADLAEVVQRAKHAGVVKALLPNIDSSTIAQLKATAGSDPDFFRTMMGLHPCDVHENWMDELALIEADLFAGGHVAVGEIGLDLYWDKSSIQRQAEAFAIQLNWAKQLNLPVAVHCRNAYPEVIAALTHAQDGNLRGVLHCFTGNLDQAKVLIDLGFYLGIGGVVTFKNGGIDAIIADLPTNRLLLETDSPYLAPIPHRGKRNETAYVAYVAKKVAELRGISAVEVAAITTANARALFPNLN